MNGPDNSGETRINYLGPSMNPTLKAGDALSVAAYGQRGIQKGDIIVFHSPAGSHLVVHRVAGIGPQGVYTRGDNNNCNDPWVLHPEQIIGRVVSVQRKNKHWPVSGGIRGRVRGRCMNIFKHLNAAISKSLHPLYHMLAASGIFRMCLPASIRPEIVIFRKPAGEEILLTWGWQKRLVIGRWLTGQGRWQFRRPFRLLVNEAAIRDALKDRRLTHLD